MHANFWAFLHDSKLIGEYDLTIGIGVFTIAKSLMNMRSSKLSNRQTYIHAFLQTDRHNLHMQI